MSLIPSFSLFYFMQAAFSVKYNFITVSMSSFKSRKISSAQYGKLHLSVLDY